MQNQLQKAIDLVKKTGDRLLVFDSAKPDNVYVVMNLKDYENLVLGKSEVRGLTEDELLDKINRDIAIWKSEQEFSGNSGNNDNFADRRFNGKFGSEIDLDNDFYNKFDSGSIAGFDKKEEKKSILNKAWSIPTGIKEAAEEVVEEDRQYLEDVRF
ncbi:hypothetical protein KKC83_05060 [Patescibacteria group bacterium]|nr:hypothetical protein [Candidatus Falkowbacteria bacterium]MBU3906258.1 hypothetical protein [Patescibacteria group bacterium]MCG2697890.1 hypothetical protein [Candidatus Parcubacteria bacterium]MBU4015709.1 hypothetical protein [Patescibacteria group bacterium]MBU4026887.1 hypothetical protein [Patescibacteria group bacterium]